MSRKQVASMKAHRLMPEDYLKILRVEVCGEVIKVSFALDGPNCDEYAN